MCNLKTARDSLVNRIHKKCQKALINALTQNVHFLQRQITNSIQSTLFNKAIATPYNNDVKLLSENCLTNNSSQPRDFLKVVQHDNCIFGCDQQLHSEPNVLYSNGVLCMKHRQLLNHFTSRGGITCLNGRLKYCT